MHLPRRSPLLLSLTLLSLPLGGACVQTISGDYVPEPSLSSSIAESSARHDVPASLLYAAGHVETRWQLPGDADGEHGAPAYTRLGVREDQLDMLSRYSDDAGALATSDAAAIDAFAAALAAARDELGIPKDAPLIDWLPALALVGAPDDEEVGRSWALEVMRVVARGFEDTTETGEVIALPGGEVSEEELEEAAEPGFGAFYVPGTDSPEVDRWLPARYDHWHAGRGGVAIDRIIIHTIEGSYDSAIAWFRSSSNPYKTSSHYVIRDSDGHITQMVREADTAYHIGGYNSRSIGIEHEGYAGRGGFSDEMYRASAKLVRDICIRRGIPMDRTHIIGHVEVPGATHWDPGPHWDWARFMTYVRQAPPAPQPAASTRVEADVNGDGRADLVTLHSGGSAYVYRGTSSGTFQSGVSSFGGTMNSALFDGSGHLPLGVADVNGDGRADLVTAHSNGRVYTYLGTSSGGFGSRVDSFNGTFNLGTRDGVGHLPAGVADVTGDGRADLVTVHTNGNAYVYPGQSSGRFGNYKASFNSTMDNAITGSGHWPVGVADVDGNGRADLVTMHNNGNAYVYAGNADGSFGGYVATFANTLNSALHDGSGHEFAGLADVTGDDRADLVTVRGGTAYVYPGRSDRKFGGSAASFGGTLNSALFDGSGHEIAGVLDVSGDGHADLVTVHTNGNGYVYLGTSGGGFGTRRDLFNGTMNSSAHDGNGHQMVSEPWWRRAGCGSSGCR